MSFCLLLAPRPALAWLETTINSDNIAIELERSGTAVVTHELLVRVRGGPLKELVLADVDADAEPLPDGTVVRARAGEAAGYPIPVAWSLREVDLVGRVEYKPGLRGGSFLFRVSYRTNLGAAGRLRPASGATELRWQGPSLDNGVDSMQLLLRVPRAAQPPRLPMTDAGAASVAIGEDFGGVFLSTLRRGSEHDELEMVRPHVAKQERVSWRAIIDRTALSLELPQGEAPAEPPAVISRARGARVLFESRSVASMACAAGLVFGLLVWFKSSAFAAACHIRKASPVLLVPMPRWLRPLVSAGALALAVWAGFRADHSAWAGILLLTAIACAVHSTPRVNNPLRGPGQWQAVAPATLFDKLRCVPPPDRYFNAGLPSGFLVFVLLIGATLSSALWVFNQSPYHGVLLALLSTALFPIFFTGRSTELPTEPLISGRTLLAKAFKCLSRERSITIEPIVRIALANGEPDEQRLRLLLRRPLQGLYGMEIGVDYHHAPNGCLLTPFVVVRVCDGSPCFTAMPKGLLWTRGRSEDERVSVIRPRVPTFSVWVALVRRLVRVLSSAPGARDGQLPSKALSSSGNSAVAAKPSRSAAPVQAT